MNLYLRSPLFSSEEDKIHCYELNPDQSRNIEPDREMLLKGKVNSALLPIGQYLFTQRRCEAYLGGEDWLDMAVEQQKDGLWERNKLGNLLYVRFLHEDGAFVTQLFRTLI
jgi:hypothetical protein